LLNAAQALEWAGLDDPPKSAFEFVARELNEVVERIADTLQCHLPPNS